MAPMPPFVEQGQGILINNVSIGGFIPTPYAAAYAASKFGIRALSNSLRQELRAWPDIHVCAVYSFFMDTPGVQHGANYTGRPSGRRRLSMPPSGPRKRSLI